MRLISFLPIWVLILSGCSSLLPFEAQLRVGDRVDLGEITYDGLPEVSGIAASQLNPDVFWVHNDSGDTNRIYGIDRQAQHMAIVTVPGCKAWDWEDIAVGPGPVPGVSYVYVANIGDNLQLRKEIQVCRFPEPRVFYGITVDAIDVVVLRFRYPDGPHDAEALFVDPKQGDVYLVTKRDVQSIVYRASGMNDGKNVQTLERVASLPVTGICAADISSDGREIIAKTLSQILLWRVLEDETLSAALQRLPTRLPYVREPQGEAIAWGAQMEGYYTVSEKVFGLPAHLYFYPRN